MRKLLFFFFLGMSVLSYAQIDTAIPPKAAPRVVQSVETTPSYPGGMEAFYKKIVGGINSANIKSTQNTSSRLYFHIEPNGKISDLKAEGYNESFNNEIIRVMKTIKTKWVPAKSNGKAVRYKMTMPFKFEFAD